MLLLQRPPIKHEPRVVFEGDVPLPGLLRGAQHDGQAVVVAQLSALGRPQALQQWLAVTAC